MALDLTGLGSLFDFGSKVLDRVIPDPIQRAAAQTELLKITVSKDLAVMANDTALIKAQTDINLEEAKSSNFFVSGGRPAMMWTGVIGCFYQWLIVPLGSFSYTLYTGHALPVQPPTMDPNIMVMISSLLGIHIISRTVEKTKGVAA